MKKILFLLLLGLAPALAQDGPNHSVPVFGGVGFSGFRSAGPCSTGQSLVWGSGSSADPSCASTVTPVAAACDGTTDDTAVINAAETALNSSGGGTLVFPKGTCIVTGVTKRSSTIWQGQGIGVTILKMKASTTANAVVQGLNAYTLFGTSSFSGIENWSIQDMTLDGNRANGGTSDCLGVYGWAWKVLRIESMNCTGWGLRTEYPIAIDGSLPDHGDNASSWFNDSLVHDNNLGGVQWAGPQDSTLIGNYVYRNLVVGIQTVSPGGVALKIANSHVWGSSVFSRQAVTGLRLDAGGNKITNSLFEGSTGQQVWLRSNGNIISGGNIFYVNVIPNSVYGIRIGDTGGGVSAGVNTILTEIENTQAGALFFDNDSGTNLINVNGFNSTPGSVGYTGTPHAFDIINFVYGGGVTNATLSQLPANLSVAGSTTTNYVEVLGPNLPTHGITKPAANTVDVRANNSVAGEFVGVASGVNYFQFINGATGAGPGMAVVGADTNIGWGITSKGTSGFSFFTNSFNQQQFQINHTASANRNLAVTGSNSGNPVLSSTAGAINLAPNNGHLVVTGGSSPTNSACAGFALGTGSTDTAGRVTYTSATTCTINFGAAFANAPFCQVTPGSAASTVLATTSTTQLAVTFGTAQTAFFYHCDGA